MPKVAAVKTLVTAREVYRALQLAWVALFGEHAKRESLCVLLAQWALETGHGKACWNYNLGNIKSFQKGGEWCFFRCNEIIKGKVVWFEPDHPACCFVAYRTLNSGAEAYLDKLHTRFAKAWPFVLAGDPAQFTIQLKAQGYFTAYLEDYLGKDGKVKPGYKRTMVSLFNRFMRETVETMERVEFDVKDYQTKLQKLGYYKGAIDGVDGRLTDKAVRAFQAKHFDATGKRLKVDGDVGPLTLAALTKAAGDG